MNSHQRRVRRRAHNREFKRKLLAGEPCMRVVTKDGTRITEGSTGLFPRTPWSDQMDSLAYLMEGLAKMPTLRIGLRPRSTIRISEAAFWPLRLVQP